MTTVPEAVAVGLVVLPVAAALAIFTRCAADVAADTNSSLNEVLILDGAGTGYALAMFAGASDWLVVGAVAIGTALLVAALILTVPRLRAWRARRTTARNASQPTVLTGTPRTWDADVAECWHGQLSWPFDRGGRV